MAPRKTLRVEDLTFIIDSREQRPLEFSFGDAADTQKKVRTIVQKLDTGDYSVAGLEKSECVIERKSLDDLLACVGRERERFDREIHRLLAFNCKAVVVEASWENLRSGTVPGPMLDTPWRSSLDPRQVMGSVIGWQALGIPFFFHADRTVIANYVGNMLWIHARRCYERLLNFVPGTRIESDPEAILLQEQSVRNRDTPEEP